MTIQTTLDIHGVCDPAFAPLEAAFRDNFAARGELGAALCLVYRGRTVVDLWGGVRDADTGAPWGRETVVNVWSTTKGVAALCVAGLVARGVLAYDAPVARYWPEFAVGGKGEVTVGQLLSHQAGLCGFEGPTDLAGLLDQPTAEARLAAQAPLWPPGSTCGYHALTMGALVEGLVARAAGRPLRAVLAELAGPGARLALGLPSDWAGDVATIVAPPAMASTDAGPGMSALQAAALANPVLAPTDANRADWRAASLPSANGHATARALAELYAAFLEGRLVGPESLAAATRVRVDAEDLVLGLRARWAAGFLRNVHGLYGPSEAAFGHSGWGGSFAFADPDTGLAMAYTLNRMGPTLVGEPRAVALVEAAFSVLG